MIGLLFPEPLIWVLRWLLLLGPVALVILMAKLRGISRRGQIGGLFAFLYGLGMVYATHSLALHLGWWRYGWDTLMLNGLPADILIGGALLCGPGLYFTFPNTRPILLILPIVVLAHGTIFRSLEPMVTAGPYWWFGVMLVFATAHLPSLHLAKWTEEDSNLPWRVALLALLYAGLALGILPALIMQAMGGSWALTDRPLHSWLLMVPPMGISWLIGLAAVQMLALQGEGTAIPLDPTKRLVTTGIYAYVSNPMQLSAALSWIILGAFLQNIWIAAAAVMAWIFVQGMVRWHHRNDLAQRFPEGWARYRQNVGEWLPRWKPWSQHPGTLTFDSRKGAPLGTLLSHRPALNLVPGDRLHYSHPDELRSFDGLPALCMALTQVNFLWALIGHLGLLVTLPAQSLLRRPAQRKAG